MLRLSFKRLRFDFSVGVPGQYTGHTRGSYQITWFKDVGNITTKNSAVTRSRPKQENDCLLYASRYTKKTNYLVGGQIGNDTTINPVEFLLKSKWLTIVEVRSNPEFFIFIPEYFVIPS